MSENGRALSPAIVGLKELTYEKLCAIADGEMARFGEVPIITVRLSLGGAVGLVADLQLALRHPSNNGWSAKVARDVIAGLIQSFEQAQAVAVAEIARRGNDAAHDSHGQAG